MTEKIGGIVVETVDFDEELYKKNIEENDFSDKQTYEGKDGKGDEA
jgi:hypothetical protein